MKKVLNVKSKGIKSISSWSSDERRNSKTNTLALIENNNTSSEVVAIDNKLAEKICNDIVQAQENTFAPVDEDSFEDNSLCDSIHNELELAQKSGAFIPTKELTLIYGSENRTKIFAKRVCKNGNIGYPVIVFAYPDGHVSSEIEIKTAELMELSYGNYGEEKEGIDKSDIADAKRLLKRIKGKIFSYWHTDIKISPTDLLKLITKNLTTLKVDRGDALDITVVYSSIYKYVMKMSNYKCYLVRKGYYALTSEDMLEVAGKLDTTVVELIKIIKQNNLLHVQPSAGGNQSEVKGVGSCYCIRILAKYQPEQVEDFNGNALEVL